MRPQISTYKEINDELDRMLKEARQRPMAVRLIPTKQPEPFPWRVLVGGFALSALLWVGLILFMVSFL